LASAIAAQINDRHRVYLRGFGSDIIRWCRRVRHYSDLGAVSQSASAQSGGNRLSLCDTFSSGGWLRAYRSRRGRLVVAPGIAKRIVAGHMVGEPYKCAISRAHTTIVFGCCSLFSGAYSDVQRSVPVKRSSLLLIHN
jgi:hypothetical protein